VQVELAETRLGTITEGDPTRIALDAAPEVSYRGRIRQVWPTADRQKATVEMRVEFLERPPVLKPEMGARVTFLAKAPKDPKDGSARSDGESPDTKTDGKPVSQRPRVDAAAIVSSEGRRFVFVVTDGKARRVEVKAGATSAGRVEIESGLSGGETVVLSPPPSLRDGDAVQTKEIR
jgi:multidrug efflux pump subunit AcrA (membrane-fusion protein)